MDGLREYWQAMSPPWKAFNVAFLILLPFFIWFLADPVWGTIAAAVWASVVGGTVRLFTRTRRPPWQ